jgi:putative Holliday junction resolvase
VTAPDAPGAVLGLDLGQARIGVAVSDPRRRLAIPLGTVATGAPSDLRAVAALVREHGATAVVVGHPLTMAGERGEAARHAEAFVEALRAVLGPGVAVDLQDERLSTVQASRSLGGAGVRGRAQREVIDRTAAAIVLQAYLDRVAAPGSTGSDQG